MFNRLLKIFGVFTNRKKPCKHQKNYTQVNWITYDGTLMTKFNCHDCGHSDFGHVYGEENDEWRCRVTAKDGKVTKEPL